MGVLGAEKYFLKLLSHYPPPPPPYEGTGEAQKGASKTTIQQMMETHDEWDTDKR